MFNKKELKKVVTVIKTEAVVNNRWETTYSVIDNAPTISGELYFSADTDPSIPEPFLDEKWDNSINVPLKDWLKAKMKYYTAQGIYFSWYDDIK